MKKLLTVVLAAVFCLSLAACGGSGGSGKQPPAADVVKAVADKLTFKDEMMVVDPSVVSNFYMLDADKVEEISMYTSATRATAEEVTVIKMKDASDIKLAEQAAATRIEDQKIAYESYVPEEMTKINGAVTATQGNYVLLVMADDPSGSLETFTAQLTN